MLSKMLIPVLMLAITLFTTFWGRHWQEEKRKIVRVIFILSALVVTLVSMRIIYDDSREIKKLNNLILSSITGGDSYCYIETRFDMSGFVNFSLKHVGKFPLYDVDVIIHDISKRSELMKAMQIPRTSTRQELNQLQKHRDLIGESIRVLQEDVILSSNWRSFPPGSMTMPFLRVRLPLDKQEQQYLVKIYARNGAITQPIKFLKVAGDWHMSTRVQNYDNVKLKFTELRNQLDPDVPLKETYAGE